MEPEKSGSETLTRTVSSQKKVPLVVEMWTERPEEQTFSEVISTILSSSSLIHSSLSDNLLLIPSKVFILGGLQNHCRWWLQP